MVTSSELIYDLDDQHNFSESERTSIKYCSEDFTWRLMKIGDTCADGKWFVRSSVIDDSAFSLPSSDDQNWYVQNGDYDTGDDYEMRMEYIRIIKHEELREPSEDDYGSGCLFRDDGEDLLGPVEPSDLDVGFYAGNAHYQMLTSRPFRVQAPGECKTNKSWCWCECPLAVAGPTPTAALSTL